MTRIALLLLVVGAYLVSVAGPVLLATCAHAEHLAQSRELIGHENVLVLGSHRVDLAGLRAALGALVCGLVATPLGEHVLGLDAPFVCSTANVTPQPEVVP